MRGVAAAQGVAADKDAMISKLITELKKCEEKVKSLQPAPAALAPAALAPAALAPAALAPAALAPAALAPAVHYQGLQGHDLLSNNINTVNNFIRAHLEVKGKEYTKASGQSYETTLGGRNIVLKCMIASGNNLDCFVHSFLTAVFPAFRSAVAEQRKYTGNKPYLTFATEFRTNVIPRIITYIYNERAKTEGFKQLSPKEQRDQYDLVSQIINELLAPNTELPDDLIPYLCNYYNIRILLFGPASINHLSTSRLIGNGGEIYAISNPNAVHFEPCRLQGTRHYTLTLDESEAFTSRYIGPQETKSVIERERHFADLNIAKATPEKVGTPGNVTQAYLAKDPIVLEAERLYDLAKVIKKSLDRRSTDKDILDTIQTYIRDVEIDYVSKNTTPEFAMNTLLEIQEYLETFAPTSVAAQVNPAPQTNEWACEACTYNNPDTTNICGACGTPRPKKGGKRRARTHRKKQRTGFRRISSHSRRR
jgi:hypothetical protein